MPCSPSAAASTPRTFVAATNVNDPKPRRGSARPRKPSDAMPPILPQPATGIAPARLFDVIQISDQFDGRRLREVRYGSFRRTFGLPAQVTAEALTASYDAGVLTVRVKDAFAGTAAKRIEVAAGGADEIEAPAA